MNIYPGWPRKQCVGLDSGIPVDTHSSSGCCSCSKPCDLLAKFTPCNTWSYWVGLLAVILTETGTTGLEFF